MPRVSVIVPAHDAEAFIEATLASVRAQTFADWEAIVADDASGDATAERVRAIGDPRITVVRTDRNRGPAGARNLAARHATGELIALLDADDAWLPEYLERQLAAYDAAAPLGLLGCDAHYVSGGRRLERTHLDRIPPAEGTVTVERLLRGNPVFISALFPRAVAEEAGWFDEALFGTEDHDLWLRIAEAGHRVVVRREPLALYTVAESSVSSNLGRMGRNMQLLYERALERGRLTPRQQRIARRQLRYYAAMEAVAEREGMLGKAPLLARVVVTNPGRWGGWLRALRAGGRSV
jgi:glycosyltransferase involved in cell wall biosynthesis